MGDDDQFDLFRKTRPLPTGPILSGQRKPTAERPGRHIDHRFSVEVIARQPKTGKLARAGYVDKRQRFFQGGG